MTVCTTALYMLYFPKNVSSTFFRWLVAGIVLTLFYDITWFSIRHSDLADDGKQDGGMETAVRKFSLYMSYISFFVRLIVIVIFWKASTDFERIIQQKIGDDDRVGGMPSINVNPPSAAKTNNVHLRDGEGRNY